MKKLKTILFSGLAFLGFFSIAINTISCGNNSGTANNNRVIVFKQNNYIKKTTWVKQITHIKNTTYLGTRHGLYFLYNGDKNFHQNTFIPVNCTINKIIEINNILYLGTQESGLWISNDYGKTFFHNKLIPFNFRVWTIMSIDNKIYIGGDGDSNSCGLLISSDQGKTFVSNQYFKNKSVEQITKIDDSIYILYDGSYIDGSYISFSTNEGKTFYQIKSLPTNLEITKIIKIYNAIYICSFQGIWVSYNDGRFFGISKVFPANSLIITITIIDNIIYAGGKNFWVSYNHGKTFIKNKNLNSGVGIIKKIENTIFLACSDEGSLYYSNDKGKTFSKNKSIPEKAGIYQILKINNTIYIGTNRSGLYTDKN